MTSRTISMVMRAESPRQSERRLNSPTHSTRRPSSKKQTRCSCGLGYYLLSYIFAPRTYSDFRPYLSMQANVMLSYKIPAAIELLKSKLEAANTSLNHAIEDLEFIREQMTVMEVNTARVYNWDVKRRRERREKDHPAEAVDT